MLLGLRTALYAAPDLAAATAWYRDVLGFAPYFDEPFYVGFNVGGFELGLVPDAKVVEVAACYWGVTDARAAFARLLELGATAHEEPHEVGGGIVVAAVRDPAGNVLGVIENPQPER